MRRILLVVIGIVLFVLQLSFIPALRPFGVVPNVGLALVALVGLYGTASLALVMAVGGGLALDLVSGTDFGLYVGLLALVALTAGYIHRAGLNQLGPLVGIVLVVVATLVQDLVILAGLIRSTDTWPFGHLIVQIGTEVVLNAILVIALRPLIHWLLPTGNVPLEITT